MRDQKIGRSAAHDHLTKLGQPAVVLPVDRPPSHGPPFHSPKESSLQG